jgi:hypothetical protein
MAKRGRISLRDQDPETVAEEIEELIVDLKHSTDLDEKKRIRRALRRRGHAGGLGITKKRRTVSRRK